MQFSQFNMKFNLFLFDMLNYFNALMILNFKLMIDRKQKKMSRQYITTIIFYKNRASDGNSHAGPIIKYNLRTTSLQCLYIIDDLVTLDVYI